MATAVYLLIDGMCGIANRAGTFELYLLAGTDHGSGEPLHEATLTAPIQGVDWKDADFWEPESLFVDSEGRQRGLWPITFASQIEIGKSGATPWPDRTTGLDLAEFHKGEALVTKTRDQIRADQPGATVITLGAGEMSAFRSRNLIKTVGGAPEAAKAYTSAWKWAGEGAVLRNATNGRSLTFSALKDKSLPVVTLTNVARITDGEGLMHFGHYYQLLETTAASEVTIGPDKAEEDVYDCIPPGALP